MHQVVPFARTIEPYGGATWSWGEGWIQGIIHQGTDHWGPEGDVAATLRPGGDMPFSKRVAGVPPAPQVACLFNEGVWHKDTGSWSGLEVRRIMERDQASHACFLAKGKSLLCFCSVTPLLVMPRQWVIPCILHCTMAIGRL